MKHKDTSTTATDKAKSKLGEEGKKQGSAINLIEIQS
jgi:hypothetical protein